MKTVLLSLFLLSIQLYSQTNLKDNNQMYSFVYEFNNYSLGPIRGTHRAKIYMKDNQIISIINLKTGTISKSILGIDKLIEAIESDHTQLVIYDDNHFPKIVKPKSDKKLLGSGYLIEIEDFSFVNDSNISAKQERIAEWHKNHQKWSSLDIANYHFIYQDSREKGQYMEGVQVTVVQRKIVDARNVRNVQKIPSSLFASFLTINHLFKIVKQGLEQEQMQEIEVLYNKKYGYPYLIISKEKNQIEYQIFTRNLKQGL